MGERPRIYIYGLQPLLHIEAHIVLVDGYGAALYFFMHNGGGEIQVLENYSPYVYACISTK